MCAWPITYEAREFFLKYLPLQLWYNVWQCYRYWECVKVVLNDIALVIHKCDHDDEDDDDG